jgi:phosphoserine phosphatase
MNNSHILFSVSGPDHPGITSTLMKGIVSSGQKIGDMGQSVTHNLLSLSIFVEITKPENEANLIKELLFATKQMGLSLEYKVVKEDLHFPWYDYEKFILNCVAVNKIPPEFLLEISQTLASFKVNILRIDNVHPTSFKSLEMATSLPPEVELNALKTELLNVSVKYQVDIAFLKDNVFRRSKRLIVFDMDSTLIQTEVIDEMAKACGKGDEVKEITERAMNGEIDFDQSLIERVSKLKGLKSSELENIYKDLKLTPGVEEFVNTVKSLGYKIAIISGGFTYFADSLKTRLGLDYSFANELEIKQGKLTGKIQGNIINANQKATLLNLIAQQEKISLEQVVAVGDGANDLPMLATAGLGIAFHAKDIVRKEASHHMSHGPMTSILYFLGIPGPIND